MGSIVFVHGLRGSARGSWAAKPDFAKKQVSLAKKVTSVFHEWKGNSKEKDVFWPEEFLAQDIPEARLYTYGYDASVSLFFDRSEDKSIYGIGRDLVHKTAIVRSKDIYGDGRKRSVPIIFIAHSLGGLVVEAVSPFRLFPVSIVGYRLRHSLLPLV